MTEGRKDERKEERKEERYEGKGVRGTKRDKREHEGRNCERNERVKGNKER